MDPDRDVTEEDHVLDDNGFCSRCGLCDRNCPASDSFGEGPDQEESEND